MKVQTCSRAHPASKSVVAVNNAFAIQRFGGNAGVFLLIGATLLILQAAGG